MPNNLKSSDPKPLGFIQRTRRSQDQTSTVTYSSTTTTYSNNSVLYGGADNVFGEYPQVKSIVSL